MLFFKKDITNKWFQTNQITFVQLFFLNPAWNFVISWFDSKNQTSLSLIILSFVLHKQLVKAISLLLVASVWPLFGLGIGIIGALLQSFLEFPVISSDPNIM